MRTIFRQLTRIVYGGLAFAMLSGLVIPSFANDVLAYGLPTSRSVEMSNATVGQTGTTYTVSFTTATAGIIQGLVVNFCDDYPIINQSCGYNTAGTSIGIGSAALSAVTGTNDNTVGASDWQISSDANTGTAGNGVILVATNTAAANTSIVPNHPLTFTFTGLTNPTPTACTSTNASGCTFYARILTYTTNTAATSYKSQTIGTPTDAGGAAMSLSTGISVTAKVMEQISFCVSGASITNCNSVSAPSVTLGNGTGVLDTAAVYTGNAYTMTSTNATHGVVVRMKDTSSTNCGGLSANGGTSCAIPAVNTGNVATPAAAAITAGTPLYGMCVTAGSANTAAQAPYNGSSCTTYGMDDTSGPGSTTSVITTYGSPIFSSTGTLSAETDTLKFAATSGNTVPAGIYTANESLIATGTY